MASVPPPAQHLGMRDDPATLYRLIAETIPHMVWTARPEGGLDYFNHRVLEYTGLDSEALAGWAWRTVIHADDLERCLSAWTRALQTGERYEIEYRLRRADGAYRWHHGSAVPLRGPAERIVRWFGTCVDIEREVQSARILESMVEERTAEVGELVAQLVATQESERRRVAGELHDLIGQNLTALGIELAVLRQALPAGTPARLDGMRALLERTIAAVRGVMSELRPPELEEYGLVAALRRHAEEFAGRTGMQAALHVTGPAARLPRERELALFRIVQEALVNAAKHSGGSAVEVGLDYGPQRVRVVVEDDGRGFAQPVGARSARRGGWGLRLMRERAAALGGSLRVEFPGKGTRVVLDVPRAEEAH